MALKAISISLAAVACSTSGTRGGDAGTAPGFKDYGADHFVVEAGSATDSGREAGTNGGLNPLCGVGSFSCDSPDDPLSCADAAPPPPIEDGGKGPADASADASGDASSGSDAGGPALDGSADAASTDATLSEPDTGYPLGPDLEPPPAQASAYSCQVRSESGEAFRSCELAGHGGRGAPCTSSRDCAPGFACVGDQGAGQCQRFCCEGSEGCVAGSYCAERPLREGTQGSSLVVPVCVPADACRLDEAHPCEATDDQPCTCGPEESCAVVRSDGTTSCVIPGDGVDGEPCPCAAGYHCVAGMLTCAKVCRTSSSKMDECGAGRCQAAANFPEGFGLCVGMTPTAR